MRRFAIKTLPGILLGILIGMGVPESGYTQEYDPYGSGVVSGGGGIFFPYQGNTGWNGMIQALANISPQERMGVEFEVRKYETKMFKVKNVDIQSYNLRWMGQYLFRPHGFTPYLGFGLGVSLSVFDEDKIDNERSTLNVKQSFGFGYGVMGLVGLEAPLGKGFALFVEGRASADFLYTNIKKDSGGNKIGFENLSGFNGMGGIRFRF